MSIITEQVEYLINLSNKHPFDSNIPTLQRACKEAANTIERLAAKVREDNVYQKAFEDAISRQAVLKTLDDMDNVLDEDRTIENYKELLKECYEVLPPVNPTKTGEWIFVDKAHEHAHCSECDYGNVDLLDGRPHNYCPNCGCRMVEPMEGSE